MEGKFSRAADAVRVGLSPSLAKSGIAGVDVLHLAPLAAERLGLSFVTAEGNADIVVAVRVKQRSFAGREQDVEDADVLVLENKVMVWFLLDRNGLR
jgi:hypothetical protein